VTFDGKVVLVTGGSKGLGRAMALGYADAGGDVVVSSRKVEACEVVAEAIRAKGRRALAVGCHVGDWGDCEQLVQRVVDEFGRIDVLVNNAGIAPVPPSLEGVTEDLFDKTFAVNVKGPLRLMGLVAPHMPRGGAIINISSKASLRPSPFTMVYAAAKAALNTVTKAASQELGPRGIRVNAIVCGPFHSESFDRNIPTVEAEEALAGSISLRRVAASDEIVGTALFLGSDASAYMTGALLELDGGGS
jgi:NAD(P)-dependent dehydrogenase (short-subunit alcohol dehydrogenase family)